MICGIGNQPALGNSGTEIRQLPHHLRRFAADLAACREKPLHELRRCSFFFAADRDDARARYLLGAVGNIAYQLCCRLCGNRRHFHGRQHRDGPHRNLLNNGVKKLKPLRRTDNNGVYGGILIGFLLRRLARIVAVSAANRRVFYSGDRDADDVLHIVISRRLRDIAGGADKGCLRLFAAHDHVVNRVDHNIHSGQRRA